MSLNKQGDYIKDELCSKCKLNWVTPLKLMMRGDLCDDCYYDWFMESTTIPDGQCVHGERREQCQVCNGDAYSQHLGVKQGAR